MMSNIEITAEQLGAFAAGMLDVVFAFSIALERKGLLDRREIVDTLRTAREQISEQEQGRQTARSGVVDLMLAAFKLPVAGGQVRERWKVIDGGNGD